MLVSSKLLRQWGFVFRRVENVRRKKSWENVRCILVSNFTQTFLSCFLIFTSFNTALLILLAKVILIASHLKVTNSGGLMLLCRWAGVNDLVPINSVPQLSQHLLAQSHRYYRVLNLPRVFFRFTFSINLFISRNNFKD